MNLMLFRVVVARLLTLAKTVSAAECINCDLIVVVVDVEAQHSRVVVVMPMDHQDSIRLRILYYLFA